MPMDEIIREIERADVEDVQDILQALQRRYRELYPRWRFLFMSADTQATDETSKIILELITEGEKRIHKG